MNKEWPIEEYSDLPNVQHAANLVYAALTQQSIPIRLNANGPTLAEVWSSLRREVYDLMCTDSDKYKNERAVLKTTAGPAIASLTTYLTKDLGVPIASASTLASLALLLPIKIMVTSWCHAYDTHLSQLQADEIAQLQQLTDSTLKK